MKTKQEVSVTVLRAIKIINYLNEVPGPQGVSEISKHTELSSTIVHRLLTTLKVEGMVFQDPRSKLYSLGAVFLDYANKILTEMPLAPVIEPWLIKMRDTTGETAGFYVPSGQMRVCALEYESQQEIRRSVGVGKRQPLYIGASGRAILAFQSKELQERILLSVQPEEREQIRLLLEETKENGYATNEEEISANVAALSAPIFDQRKRVIGALSVSGPMFRWNRRTMECYIPVLLDATNEISQSLI